MVGIMTDLAGQYAREAGVLQDVGDTLKALVAAFIASRV